jgi:hypothetical protein
MNFDTDDIKFLRELTRDVVQASRVKPGQSIAGSPPNTMGHTLIRPGGRDCYPAMWVRDFSMSLDSGFITVEEAKQHLRLIASRQNGPRARKLKSGATIPPWAIPDHINFDGGAVFFPGTYSAGEDQGGEPFGLLPPADDHYEFIHIAHWIWQRTNDATFLDDVVDGLSLRDRLIRAFDVPRTDDATGGMVTTSATDRAVGFGFCDAIYLTGAILFASLLRYRAARELARLTAAKGDERNVFAMTAVTLASHVARVFADPAGSGWLLAATEIGRQPDVWGTLFALHLGVLAPEEARAARGAVIDAVRDGTITLEGAVRHVPATTNWEKVAPGVAVGTYQNGAYWHTPTGWLIAALKKHQPVLARNVFVDYITHLRAQDFRKGPGFGAPWECFGPDGKARQNAVYMTSVALPLAVIEHIEG